MSIAKIEFPDTPNGRILQKIFQVQDFSALREMTEVLDSLNFQELTEEDLKHLFSLSHCLRGMGIKLHEFATEAVNKQDAIADCEEEIE